MDSPVNNKQVSRTDKKMLPLVLVKLLRDALPEMDNNPLLQSGGGSQIWYCLFAFNQQKNLIS